LASKSNAKWELLHLLVVTVAAQKWFDYCSALLECKSS